MNQNRNIFAVSLYNNKSSEHKTKTKEGTTVTIVKRDPSNQLEKPAVIAHRKTTPTMRRPYPIRVSTRKVTPTYWKLLIHEQPALSGGQLTIESNIQLCNRIFSVLLPVDKRLEKGLLLTMFTAHPMHTRIEYDEPTRSDLARLLITPSDQPPEDNTKQLISVKIDGMEPPVVTVLKDEPIVGSLMYQARLFIDLAMTTNPFMDNQPIPYKLPENENTLIYTTTEQTTMNRPAEHNIALPGRPTSSNGTSVVRNGAPIANQQPGNSEGATIEMQLYMLGEGDSSPNE